MRTRRGEKEERVEVISEVEEARGEWRRGRSRIEEENHSFN